MITITKIQTKNDTKSQQIEKSLLQDFQNASFLQEVIEGMQDGILILSEDGNLIYANKSAYRILCQIKQESPGSAFIPSAIWNLCNSLLEQGNHSLEKSIVLSSEIVIDKSKGFRFRVRWLDIGKIERSCFLITLENKCESLKNVVMGEIKKYDLTPREAEIWCLYRAKVSYKEISEKLYITINTVKKHMKNIHTKRQAYLNCEV
ncbi:MAG: helix-turn-helix transcriptional regulator [Scytonema sp. PMC 1069.18]|nr:helix-turn-helix transcriptional regulator [Scytonema sp. PMC 1069.18]MEC4885199.1 helix-turn-helix transcriptional regulator [Scytonema sp. PMC 1070.18]